MVCEKCQKKLGTVACPDKWKDGSTNSIEGGGRKVNENKALAKKNRFEPYGKINSCKICKQKVHQPHAHYCQGCAYKIGICAMCGKQILDTTNLKQSMT